MWKYVVPLKSDSTITDIEQQYSISIPADLKACIKANNSGSPSLNRLDFGKNKGVCFGGLLSFNKKGDDSIFSYINTFKDKNGKLSMLPFAIDPAGNFFCIKSGKVVFWDHETNVTIPVCGSFNALLNMLY